MVGDSPEVLADAELVCRARTGDGDAMHDLLATLRPAIVRYCSFRLSAYAGGRDAADDAAQETCLAVVNVLSSYSDRGLPFRAWVYAIAAHKVADSQRRFGRSAVLVDEMPEQIASAPTPEDQAIAGVEYEAALRLLAQLPGRMGDVLLLRASGVTAKRVGERLGMTVGAVNVAHSRGIARLRELVEESDELRELFAPFRSDASGSALGRVA